MPAEVSLRAVRAGKRTVVEGLAGTVPWRARVLPPRGRFSRVALVQTHAGLLAGDHVRLSVELGRRAQLELGEIGATLLYPDHGLGAALSEVRITLDADARLIWRAAPLIAAAGSICVRTVEVDQARSARLLLVEVIQLGRFAEQPGAVRLLTSARLDGAPLLHETLDTGNLGVLRSPLLAGRASMIASCLLAGERDPQADGLGALQLHLPGSLWRGVGSPAELERELAAVLARWSSLVAG